MAHLIAVSGDFNAFAVQSCDIHLSLSQKL